MDTKLVRVALQAFLNLNGEGDTTRWLLVAKKKFDQKHFPNEVLLRESVRAGHVVVRSNSLNKLECF